MARVNLEVTDDTKREFEQCAEHCECTVSEAIRKAMRLFRAVQDCESIEVTRNDGTKERIVIV